MKFLMLILFPTVSFSQSQLLSNPSKNVKFKLLSDTIEYRIQDKEIPEYSIKYEITNISGKKIYKIKMGSFFPAYEKLSLIQYETIVDSILPNETWKFSAKAYLNYDLTLMKPARMFVFKVYYNEFKPEDHDIISPEAFVVDFSEKLRIYNRKHSQE